MSGITKVTTNKMKSSKKIQCTMTFEGEADLELVKEIQIEIQKIAANIVKMEKNVSTETKLSFTYERTDIDMITLERLREVYKPNGELYNETSYDDKLLRKKLFVCLDFSGFKFWLVLYSPFIELNMEFKKP